MQPEIIVGLLSLTGTLIGSIAGIMASNKLITYRIDQLENHVNKHNDLIDRMYRVEELTKHLDYMVKEIREGDDHK